MSMFRSIDVLLLAAILCVLPTERLAAATPITGTVQPNTPAGQFLSLTMTIDDDKTRFEMTGPDFSFFAFGFDTTTMNGYSLIVAGNHANRTVVEQNLAGVGNPGSEQPTQNLSLISISHNAAAKLSTVVVERANQTGDPDDAVFSPSMTSLPLIWGYDSYATPESPNPFLDYHGPGGRGFVTITFAPVPEPNAALLTAAALLAPAGLATMRRRRRGFRST